MKWVERTLDELGFVGRGKSKHRPRNAPHLYGGVYPLIQTGDIQKANFYINSYTKTYSEEGLAQSKLWDAGTLVISIVGANTAETAILGIDACFPDSVIGFIPHKQISDVKFVKYRLELLKVQLKSISEGTARENLSLEKLLSVKFPVPPFKKQEQIGSILSAYDDLIENNLKRIKLLENKLEYHYKTLVENSENRNKENLSQYVDFVKGIEPGSKNYLDEYKEGRVQFIRVGDLSKRESNTFIETGFTKGIKCVDEDILISLDGTLGVVKFGLKGCYSSGIRKVVIKEKLSRAYMYCYLTSPFIQGVIYSHAKGSTILHASSSIKHFKIIIPEEKKLMEFNELASPVLNMIIKLNNQNSKLREARNLLLPRLMNGEIVV